MAGEGGRVLVVERDPDMAELVWVFWTGLAFLANGILGVFYLLSWPGLLEDRGIIAQLSSTGTWLGSVTWSCIALLVLAVNARRPVRLDPSSSLVGYGIAAIVAALIGLSSVLLESALPTMIVGVTFTPLSLIWAGTRLVLGEPVGQRLEVYLDAPGGQD